MIGRVYRGGDVGGLLRYLYGPGRHNEHENPHLVAGWGGDDPDVLDGLEPPDLGGGRRAFRPLIADLEAPLAYADRPSAEWVWHCPLRTAPGDRTLTDAEWAEVAADLMHRTGIAPRGDDGACRWVAVRHDDVSIHVVAVLARQDGEPVRLWRDFPKVRQTCLAAEQRYGLTSTAPADRTAATHTTRAETEKAARLGQAQPARDWLRAEVQHAATASRQPAEFLDRLRAAGVVVHERRDRGGQLVGYAVGRPGPGGDPVLYGGGKLAPDLSLPKLQRRWAQAGSDEGLSGEPGVGGREQLWARATAAAGQAAEAVRAQHVVDPDAAGDAAAAAAEVLAAAGRLLEGDHGGPLTRAARDYDRAARDTYGRTPPPSEAGLLLRAAALQLARSSRRNRSGADPAQVALLIAQITRLTLAVSRLREAQGRAAQAAAAKRAAVAFRGAAPEWTSSTQLPGAAAARTGQRQPDNSQAPSASRRHGAAPSDRPGRSR